MSGLQIGELSGIVIDSTDNKPIPYASLALLNADNRLVIGIFTDNLGEISFVKLPVGRYRLSISCIGYQQRMLNNILITSSQPVVALGRVRLRPDQKTLKEVVVTAQRALIEDKGDRLVYNAERDIAAGGSTALDVLRRIPMLSVDMNGNVKLRGNSKIKVLLNGKPSGLMARNLGEALRQIPGQMIKSVEIITNPGARYDAEGTAGIINIITKKPSEGMHAGLNGTYGNLVQSVGGYGSMRQERVSINVSGGYYEYRTLTSSDAIRTSLQNGRPVNTLIQQNEQDNTGKGANAEVSLDYDIDTTARLSVWLNAWGGNWPNNSRLSTRLYNGLPDAGGRLVQSFEQNIRMQDTYRNGEANLSFTKTFQNGITLPIINRSLGIQHLLDKTLKPELSLMMQGSYVPDRLAYQSDLFNQADAIKHRERSTSQSRNNEFTVQSDYTYPFRLIGRRDTTLVNAEVGAKVIIRDIGSNYSVEQAHNGSTGFRPDPFRSDVFEYTQQVLAAYTSMRLANAGKWSLSAGARLEQTLLGGSFISASKTVKRQYQNLIPSFIVSRTFKDKHTLRLTYTQRITRPLVWYLNPFVNASNPRQLVTGNPELNPELTHSAEVSYSLFTQKGFFINSALYLQRTNNAIDYVTSMDINTISTSKPQNIAQRTFYGIQLNTNGQPVRNLSVSGGGNVQWVDVYSPALGQQNSGMMWSLTVNASYRIGKGFSVQADGNYNAGSIMLQGRTTSLYMYSLATKKELWNKKASIVLSTNTPFHHRIRQDSFLDAHTFTAYSRNATVTRSARIYLYWQFGQSSTRSGRQRRQINNDDKAVPVSKEAGNS